MSDLLTVAEVAELVGVEPPTIRTYIYRRSIVAPTYVGRTPTWTREAIAAWIATRPSATWERKENR